MLLVDENAKNEKKVLHKLVNDRYMDEDIFWGVQELKTHFHSHYRSRVNPCKYISKKQVLWKHLEKKEKLIFIIERVLLPRMKYGKNIEREIEFLKSKTEHYFDDYE